MMLIAALLIPALAGAGLLAFTFVKAPPRLRVVNLLADAPASKRHARAGKVDAVVLHQTGFSRGLDPKRYLKVTSHFVVLADGTVVQLHPLSARLNSSHGFNGRSVAVEFVGNFPSVNGQWWKPDKFGADRVTPQQIEAGRELLRSLAAAGVRHVFAHRQSSAARGNDPGPDLWAGVGEWAIARLGFSDGGAGYAIDTGRPIPDEWRMHGSSSTSASARS